MNLGFDSLKVQSSLGIRSNFLGSIFPLVQTDLARMENSLPGLVYENVNDIPKILLALLSSPLPIQTRVGGEDN